MVPTLVYPVLFIFAAIGFGRLSERIGQRAVFVSAAVYLEAPAARISVS